MCHPQLTLWELLLVTPEFACIERGQHYVRKSSGLAEHVLPMDVLTVPARSKSSDSSVGIPTKEICAASCMLPLACLQSRCRNRQSSQSQKSANVARAPPLLSLDEATERYPSRGRNCHGEELYRTIALPESFLTLAAALSSPFCSKPSHHHPKSLVSLLRIGQKPLEAASSACNGAGTQKFLGDCCNAIKSLTSASSEIKVRLSQHIGAQPNRANFEPREFSEKSHE
jgi:hypothetical protein